MAGKTTDILNICGSVSQSVSDKSKGPGTCVSAPEVYNLGVAKPLNIQTMEFTKLQISEHIRKRRGIR